ncbi:hypothetical protein BJX65DRAFT_272776 [Aspergillus insuetus]
MTCDAAPYMNNNMRPGTLSLEKGHGDDNLLPVHPVEPELLSVDEPARNSVAYFTLKDQCFRGPYPAPYTTVCVLDPLITVERHHGKYHITARFNVETSILDYHVNKRDGHELFFQDICLQYLSASGDEDLLMEPQSDPTGAFTLTRSSSTTVSGNAGLSLSNVPAANISLGISRSRECTVEHTINSWSVSAHRIVPEVRKRHRRLNATPQYQWFWAANYKDIATLSPDLTHTVKRHVLVKRVIPIQNFPVGRLEAARSVLRARAWREKAVGERHGLNQLELMEAEQSLGRKEQAAWTAFLADWKCKDQYRSLPLEQLLEFRFCITIRLRRRYGRFHRALLFTGNRNKAKLVEPSYREKFCIRVSLKDDLFPLGSLSSLSKHDRPVTFPSDADLAKTVRIPLADTYDLRDVLAKVKAKYDGRWDELQSKEWVDLVQNETESEVEEVDASAEGTAVTVAAVTATAAATETATAVASGLVLLDTAVGDANMNVSVGQPY